LIKQHTDNKISLLNVSVVRSSVHKWLNRSRCRLGCRFVWVQGRAY